MTKLARQVQQLNQMASSELNMPFINNSLQSEVNGDHWTGLDQSILLKDCVLTRRSHDGVESKTTLQSVMSRFLERDGGARILKKAVYADAGSTGESFSVDLRLCEQFDCAELKLWEVCVQDTQGMD